MTVERQNLIFFITLLILINVLLALIFGFLVYSHNTRRIDYEQSLSNYFNNKDNFESVIIETYE